MNKTDDQLKQDIEQELLWDPLVNSAQIAVSVDHGAVSLLGAVDTYPAKWAAEDATKRVHGVRVVAHDLTVKLGGDGLGHEHVPFQRALHRGGDFGLAAHVIDGDTFLQRCHRRRELYHQPCAAFAPGSLKACARRPTRYASTPQLGGE